MRTKNKITICNVGILETSDNHYITPPIRQSSAEDGALSAQLPIVSHDCIVSPVLGIPLPLTSSHYPNCLIQPR